MSSLITCMAFTFNSHPIIITRRSRRLRCSATSESNEKILIRPPPTNFSRRDFPPDFKFGAASSAYQIEGAFKEHDKGQSIWDTFTHDCPHKIDDRSNGDYANRSYALFMKDIEILKELGVDSYRFSISWPRIFPEGKGKLSGSGIEYYSKLIKTLKENGIEPCVTLFHWDVPQALEAEYGGCLSRKFIDDFKHFARICFEYFGNEVKQWITLNEPYIFSWFGYDKGRFAPGRCSTPIGECLCGDSAREPYTVAHNLILAHAEVVNLYRSKYKNSQKGEIGITLFADWTEPYDSESYQDREAAERDVDFRLGWFMDPLVYGDYPFIMRALARNRLPYFDKNEVELVKDSYDFIGLNYYSASYARAKPIQQNDAPVSYTEDHYAEILKTYKDGPIHDVTDSDQYIYPEGIKKLLLHMKNKYNDPVMYITENGLANKYVDVNDHQRIHYIESHLKKVKEAMSEHARVKGYFVWSLMDCFEWWSGYTKNYGLYAVDRHYSYKRIQKLSGRWYSHFLEKGPRGKPVTLPSNLWKTQETQLSPANGVVEDEPAPFPTPTHLPTNSAPVEVESTA